jgi:ankyrin repeat protein
MDERKHNSAAQRLEQLGIPYSEEAFLRYIALGDNEVVSLFLQAGIRISAKNEDGDGALLIATANGHTEVAKKLIAAGADVSEFLEKTHQKLTRKKDLWDKLSALSAVATILVALIGGWFTLSYNKYQSANDTNVKNQQNRIASMDIVSKMMPYLTKDEDSKCGALIVIRTVAPDPDLAVQLANFSPSKGSICALGKLASASNQQVSQPAIKALTNFVNSPNPEINRNAFSALSIAAGSSQSQYAIVALDSAAQTNVQAAICSDDVKDIQQCHRLYPTGCSGVGRYDAFLNLLKNRALPPDSPPLRYLTAQDFSALEERVPGSADRKNHASISDSLKQLGEGAIVAVVGYLYGVDSASPDSANCQLSGTENVTWHLRIGFTPMDKTATRKLMEQKSIVAQATPYSRSLYYPGWNLEYLRRYMGRQVKVTGQLLLNNSHLGAHDDCGVAGANLQTCWRLSAWELTPTARLEVCGSESCAADSANWTALTGSVESQTNGASVQ